jgi:hypothetical protein
LGAGDFTYSFDFVDSYIFDKKRQEKVSLENREQKLREIEELLKTYKDDDLEIDSYVLNYLSSEELDSILLKLYQKLSDTVEDNREWLQQFKKI